MDHSLLPSVANAKLPAKYEAAKLAISQCAQLDECKDWSDKAQAMASYAKQVHDKEMQNMAMRIRLRAERRLGQLYDEFEKAQGKRTDQLGDSKSPSHEKTRTEAAKEIGQTKDQMIRSVRASRIPEEKFEEQVESESPPTITSLAEQGTNKKPKPEPRREDYQSDVEWKMAKGIPVYEQRGITKKAFQAGMYFGPSVRNFAEETELYDPQDVVDGLHPEGRIAIRKHIKTIENYLIRIIEKL